MAPAPPMTWNWKWKLAATGATALAGWLASPPLQLAGTAGHQQADPAPRTAERLAAVSALEEQTRRLDERAAVSRVTPASRNPFQFGARPAVRRVPEPAAAPAAPPMAAAPAPFPLRLSGIAIDTVNGIEKRTAILSGPSGVELAAAGESAGPDYRVVEVGDAFASVERVDDGTRTRLELAQPR